MRDNTKGLAERKFEFSNRSHPRVRQFRGESNRKSLMLYFGSSANDCTLLSAQTIHRRGMDPFIAYNSNVTTARLHSPNPASPFA